MTPAVFAPTSADVRAVAAQFGTPTYLYDEATLRELARAVAGFGGPFGFVPRFAVKANPSRAVLRIFHDEGLHFDASTVWEARRVIAAGIPAAKVELTSQLLGEGFDELARAGVKLVACSLTQIDQIGQALPGHAIGLRINPGEGSGGNNRTNVAGPASSFGIWFEHLAEARARTAQYGLRVVTAHHHVGSGGDPAKWAAIAARTIEFLDDLPDLTNLNLGGGFKVARVAGEKQSDLQQAAREAAALLEAYAARSGRRLVLEIEPGTFLTANAGVVVARVQDVVTTGTGGYTFVKLDTGMPEVLRPSLYGAQHPITFVPAEEGGPLGAAQPVLVVGPCCESGDLLTPASGDPEGLAPRDLPLPRRGDLAIVGGAGAYCAGMAAKNYNSIPAAPEVLRDARGALQLVRRRQTLEDVLREES